MIHLFLQVVSRGSALESFWRDQDSSCSMVPSTGEDLGLLFLRDSSVPSAAFKSDLVLLLLLPFLLPSLRRHDSTTSKSDCLDSRNNQRSRFVWCMPKQVPSCAQGRLLGASFFWLNLTPHRVSLAVRPCCASSNDNSLFSLSCVLFQQAR